MAKRIKQKRLKPETPLDDAIWRRRMHVESAAFHEERIGGYHSDLHQRMTGKHLKAAHDCAAEIGRLKA